MDMNVSSASRDLVDHVHHGLANSTFFKEFSSGRLSLDVLRDIFGQYYLWRNQFHRWFGVCIVRSPAFGTPFATDFVLEELVEHIQTEITGDHHGMCVSFLRAIGIDSPHEIQALAGTERYSSSFIEKYLDPAQSFEAGLAALAGREIVAPARNRLTIDAFERHYGIVESSQFFSLHEELEVEHFEGLWGALVRSHPSRADELLDAARTEIDAHIAFWDDVYVQVTAPTAVVDARS